MSKTSMTRQDMEDVAWKGMMDSMNLGNRIQNFREAVRFIASESFKKDMLAAVANLIAISQEGYRKDTGEEPDNPDSAYVRNNNGQFEQMTRMEVTRIVMRGAHSILSTNDF